MFVSKEPVPVSDGENTIYIRAKMSVGVRNQVIGAAAKVEGKETSVDVGAYSTALLVHNIVRWEGPAFEDVKCTPENIENLDASDPLVDAVLEEIGERNKSPDPNSQSAGSNGSKPAKARAKSGSTT